MSEKQAKRQHSRPKENNRTCHHSDADSRSKGIALSGGRIGNSHYDLAILNAPGMFIMSSLLTGIAKRVPVGKMLLKEANRVPGLVGVPYVAMRAGKL